MFETWMDVVRLGVAGALGGLIYYACREHGAIFANLRRVLRRR